MQNGENCYPLKTKLSNCLQISAHATCLQQKTSVKICKMYTLKTKLRKYVKFNENICIKDYVKHCTSNRNRSNGIIQNWHITVTELAYIFSDNRKDGRLCLIFNFGEMENELHFLCVYTTYSNYRETLILLLIMIMF